MTFPTRVCSFGLLWKEGKLGVIQLESIHWPDHFHLIGGGVEFGETPMQALIREWEEEVAIKVLKATPFTNISALFDRKGVPGSPFHTVGMVYTIEEYELLPNSKSERELVWKSPKELQEAPCFPILDSLLCDLSL